MPLLRCVPNIHVEHDDFGRHRRHLVAEAVRVDALHVRGKRVLPARLALALVDHLVVGADNLHVNVKEAALGYLEHQT